MVRTLAAKFAAEVCAGEAEAVDRSHRFPMETWKKMASLGLLRLNHDERYGGVGFDPMMEVIVIEELSKAGLTYGASYALLAHGFPTFVEKFGTQEQKQRYIPPILDGSQIGAFCLTESGAGSDAAGIVTTARRDGTDYLLNGTKQFVTAGSIADAYLVIALTNKAGEEKPCLCCKKLRNISGTTVACTRSRIICVIARQNKFIGDILIICSELIGKGNIHPYLWIINPHCTQSPCREHNFVFCLRIISVYIRNCWYTVFLPYLLGYIFNWKKGRLHDYFDEEVDMRQSKHALFPGFAVAGVWFAIGLLLTIIVQ